MYISYIHVIQVSSGAPVAATVPPARTSTPCGPTPSSVPATATVIPAQTPRPSDLAAAPTPSVPKPDVCPPQHTKSPGSTAVQVRPLMFTPHCIFVDILVVPPIHLLACALWSSRNCHWCCWSTNSHTTYPGARCTGGWAGWVGRLQ